LLALRPLSAAFGSWMPELARELAAETSGVSSGGGPCDLTGLAASAG